MPILRGSRYVGLGRTGIQLEDGTIIPYIHLRTAIKPEEIGREFVVHRVVEGDHIDALAFEFGGREEWFWIIAEINELDFPFTLKAGDELLIPTRRFFEQLK